MNRFRLMGLAIAGSILFCLTACGNGQPVAKTSPSESGSNASAWFQATGTGDVVAEINGTKIYMDEFKERMEKQSPYIRARYNTLEKKKEFLENMVRFELLAQAAIDKGYHQDPEVIRSAKQVMTQKLMRSEFESKIKREDITDEEMKAYYDEHRSEYNKPAMRRASHILIKVDEKADKKTEAEAKKRAMKVFNEAKKDSKNPNAFRKLAAKYSEDTSNKNRGGDLGYFAQTEEGGPMVKEFSEAVFKMKDINDIAKPVRTKFGFHIIRLTGKRDKIERSFDQVKGQIQHRLFKERRTSLFDQFVDDLKKKANISIHDNILEAYAIPGTAAKDKEAKAEKIDEKADQKAPEGKKAATKGKKPVKKQAKKNAK